MFVLLIASCLMVSAAACADPDLPEGVFVDRTPPAATLDDATVTPSSPAASSTIETTTTPASPNATGATIDLEASTSSAPTAASEPSGTSPTLPELTVAPVLPARVEWNGDDGFLLGANLPWYNFSCDFGCGREGGVSQPSITAEIGEALEAAAAAGITTVRWWVFPGEPWQITTDDDGMPLGVVDSVHTDLDAALALAEQHGIEYVLTLFSSPSDIPGPWLNTEVGRQRLADTLGALFARYRDSDRIMTWQLVNEPEWQIWNDIVELEPVQDLALKVSDAIHQNSNALSSIGSAHLGGLEFWQEAGLDYYTAHWYDPMASGIECALCVDYAEVTRGLETDLPIIIGEFYGAEEVDVADRLESFYERGYAGAFAWSLLPGRTEDQFPIDLEGVAAFRSARPDDIAP